MHLDPLRLASLLAVLLFAGGALAQDHWARRVGAWSNDAYQDLAIDDSGNLYAVGEFGGIIGLGTGTLISQGSLDILIAKYSPSGNLLWTRTFGGSGLDRAIKLELTADGSIAVVGQFMGTVDFGGFPLTSLGGTQDCFLLKMAQADGAVQWARRGGSADGVDQPNGVSVGPDGSIAVAGEFRGTAVFDQGIITSITDPDTGDPSVDIFLATYAADGTPLWLNHGAAEFSDRGIDVEHDLDGNVYLTGQFTDTLTLAGNVHNNAMYSAVFIARFSPAGEEEWFRAFGGGTYNQVFEMLLVEDSYLMLVGDVQGTVIFLDTEPDLFTAAEPRSSYLLKVGLDGELIAQTTWGSLHPMNTRALSVRGDDVAVFGRFMCHLTGFTAEYGAASFMATGLHDLYVARFQLSDLVFKQAQQFGGQGDKVPGGIVHRDDEDIVFAGAFERVLVFPAAGAFDAQPSGQLQAGSAPLPQCGDDAYNGYQDLRGYALKDAFIARGYVDGREPYDYFHRSVPGCDRTILEPYIVMGPFGALGADTLARCFDAALTVNTRSSFTADTTLRHTAPQFTFLWSTGQTTQTIVTQQSGWFWVDVTMGVNCYTWRDSLHLTVHPIPAVPLVNDDVVVNTNAFTPQLVRVCEPDYPWLWATNVDPANTVEWIPPGSPIVPGDSVLATITGIYTVRVITPFGCVRQNTVNVIIDPSGPLPPLDALLTLVYPQDNDLNDTIHVCVGSPIILAFGAELLLNGVPVALPYGISTLMSCTGNGPWFPIANNALGDQCLYTFTTEGWYRHRVGFALTDAPCGEDTLYFNSADSIYVVPLPVVEPVISVEAPPYMCPGDTVALIATCPNCTSSEWSGSGITSVVGDTAFIISAGGFTFEGTAISPEGCERTEYVSVTVQWNPVPLLLVDPIDAIICPDDSATIWTSAPGSQFQWFGPLGPMNVDNDSIHTSQEGFYYVEMVDTLGCLVTSDPMLITDYATPYLNILPDNVLCEPGETSILQVVTTSTSTLLWSAPFAGSTAIQQVVSQPGIYTCSVNACGITTVLSVQVFGNTANAELTVPGPFTLCPGEEVVLQGAPGQVIYYWEPGPIFNTSITVDTTGTFLLVTADANGCRDSLWTDVIVLPEYEELDVQDSAFCVGDAIILNATGDGIITWYADAAQTQVLGTGNVLDLGLAQDDLTIWVEQVVGSCGSGLVEWLIAVNEVPDPPQVSGPSPVCVGDSIALSVQGGAGTSFTWSTPSGTAQGDVLVISPVALGDGGDYLVTATNAGCPSSTGTFVLTVIIPSPLSIGNDTLICPGGQAVFTMPPGFTQPVWNGSTSGPAYTAAQAGPVFLAAVDANGCSVSDTAQVIVFAFSQPLTGTGATICFGADATLVANGSGIITWFADAALTQLVHTGSAWFFDQPADSAVYFVTQGEGQCVSSFIAVALNVTPTPFDAVLVGEDSVCLGGTIVLSVSGSNGPSGNWTTPSGTYTSASITIEPASLSDEGLYTVVPAIGPCLGAALQIMVDVLVPLPPYLGPDTVFCEGGTFALHLPAGYSAPLWSTGATTPSITLVTPGTFGVQAVDPQGCPVEDAIVIGTVGCDPVIPNVVTPNGDGVNDGFHISGDGFIGAWLRVYNRWGQVVWEGDVKHGAFRGKHQDNDEPLSEGTYYYELILDRAGKEDRVITGYFSLLR